MTLPQSESKLDRVSEALEAKLERFEAMVAKIGSRHGLQPVDRDLLVQEVRIRLWRSLREREKIAGVSASYMYRTAMSAAVDLIRRRRAKGGDATISVDESGPVPAGRRDAADEGVQRAELERALGDAVDELIESRRAVVRMHLAGYDRSEIASLLGWSEAKTRNLLYRGLDDLRAELTRRGMGPEGEET
ncbi:MAG: sigma-70 family RNA polymerase sigma factor [Gemmatimonadota bacterium]|nr:sigma-70 family RNA polymerase sigma factor [Gemmatimonadota bacterium]